MNARDSRSRSGTAQPSSLATLLRERKEEIVTRWAREARGEVEDARNLDAKALRDHLPNVLATLADAIDGSRAPGDRALLEVPDLHARERLSNGYDLGSVLHEYSLLRRTIRELACESGLPDAAELLALDDALDHATVAAVTRFTATRQKVDDRHRDELERLVLRRTRQAQALARLGQRALERIELDTLLGETVRVMADTLGVELAKVLELQPQGLRVRAGVGWREGAIEKTVIGAGDDQSPSGYALASPEGLVIVDDLARETRFAAPRLLREHDVHSTLAVAIGSKTARWGALSVCTRERRAFTREDASFLQAVASVVAAAVARRTTEAALARAEDEQRFLAAASEALARSLAREETFATVARLAVPRLADWCAVHVVADGWIEQVATAKRDTTPGSVEDDGASLRVEASRHRGAAVLRVLETGRPERGQVSADALLSWACSEGQRAALQELDAAWFVCVPLAWRERMLGVLTLAGGRSRRGFDEADLRLAEDLARRAAVAIDNARLYEDARGAIRARDDVLAVVSHDLKNPLGVITLAAEQMSRTLPEAPDLPRVRRGITTIRRSAERASKLIGDLLDAAAIESRKLRVTPTLTPVSALVLDATETALPLATEKGLSLEAKLEIDPALQVRCDYERVQQVLSNLIGNSLKFTPPGGRVTVHARESGRGVELAVTDTGVGIPPEHVPRVFERFWQPEGRRAGVGLGLFIARGIVQAHGGTLQLESEPGRGTRIAFTLPNTETLPDAAAA